MMEKLTQDMADKAWALIEEIEAMGGMTKAVESGWAKMKVEECAADKQARIDSGKDVIVGVNKYKLAKEDPIDILDIDNHAVREAQIERLACIRAMRDQAAVDAALAALTECAKTGEGNLLDLAVKAVRLRATVGEISDALEVVSAATAPTRPPASPASTTRWSNNDDWQALRPTSRPSSPKKGRRPRIMIAKLGQDGHDRGAKVVASAFADLGFDIDIGPLFQTPKKAARHAVENDGTRWAAPASPPATRPSCRPSSRPSRDQGADDIITFVGGVIPAQDYDALYRPVPPASSAGTPDPDRCPQVLKEDPREREVPIA